MSDLSARIAALPPAKRRLLELQLKQHRTAQATSWHEIQRRRRSGPCPLTWGQQRLWFVNRLYPDSPAYNVPFAGRLEGVLEPRWVARALDLMGRRHEILRTRFVEVDDRPLQVVEPEMPLTLPLVDLSVLASTTRERETQRLIATQPQAVFDLTHGPLVRLTLVRHGPARHDLLVTMAHIITDAWSMAIFFRELPALYEALRRGEPSPLPELPIQVADFAIWQREQIGEEGFAADLAYWRRQLAGAPTVLELPTDRPRPPMMSFRGRRWPLAVPLPLSRRLTALAEAEGGTLFMALLAAFGLLLGRWSGQRQLLIASPVAVRGRPETFPLIGFFIDNVVLRIDLRERPTFRQLLGRVRDITLAALSHQEAPFDKVVETLGLMRDLSRPPLVQANFVLQNVHIPQPDFEGISLSRTQQVDLRCSRFDLTLGLYEEDEHGAPKGTLEYSTDLFDHATAGRMVGHLLRLLEEAASDPDRPAWHLPMLSAEERRQLLGEWHRAAGGEAPGGDLYQRFEARAAELPEAVAVAFEDPSGNRQELSYGELEQRAARLATHLMARGVGPEVRVGLALERSPELLTAILAVLRAGGAWVPLDPSYPRSRLAFMVADAGLKLVLGSPAAAGQLAEFTDIPVCTPESLAAGSLDPRGAGDAVASALPASTLPADVLPAVAPGGLAYVIYTSGSTGRPKGVMVPHRGVVSLVTAQQRWFATGPGDRVLWFSSPSFDASVWETWMALGAGATLELATPEELMPGPDLATLLRRRRISRLNLPPSALAALSSEHPAELPTLGVVVVAGEACPAELAADWSVGRRLVNGYGPTETTVCATLGECVPDESSAPPTPAGQPPIGRPFDRMSGHVLDHGLEPVPVGVAGELCVGGAGVTRGYLGRPALTAERFVPDPFAESAGERLYRTGDRVRRLADGRLEFLGRVDHQLKLRGFRIEPGEIEAALNAHPRVRDSVVVTRSVGEGRRLVAYLEASDTGGDIAGELALALREHLRQRLPQHMTPALFVPLAGLPRTPVGKIDRAALPAPAPAPVSVVSPEGTTEETLASIWSRLLGVERVGRDDNFFDLGGDSILGIQVVSRAAAAGLRLTTRDLFERPTLTALAAAASRVAGSTAPGPVRGPCPLTPAQRWFFELESPVPGHWNLALALTSPRRLNPVWLAAAVDRLSVHHDALRARFHRHLDGWRQQIAPPDSTSRWRRVDLEALEAGDRRRAVAAASTALQTGFDLATGPLFAATLFNLGPAGGSHLLLCAHHLVMDAVSWRLLLEDLETLYRRLERGQRPALPPRTTSLPDWVAGLEGWARSPEAQRQLPLWRQTLAAAGACRLPLEAPSADLTEGSTADLEVTLEAGDTEALRTRVATAYATRPDEVVLAALAEAASSWTGDRRLFLLREGHGRDAPLAQVDLSRTVGWLTAAYPVMLDLRQARGPEEALVAVKEQLRAIPDGGLGWGVLRYLGASAVIDELAAGPRPELSFNHLGSLDPAPGASDLAPAEAPGVPRHPAGRLPHPLAVSSWVADGRLRIRFTWGRPALSRATVERLASGTLDTLRALIAHCRSPGAGKRTPSDFPLAKVGQQNLDRLLDRLTQPGAANDGRDDGDSNHEITEPSGSRGR